MTEKHTGTGNLPACLGGLAAVLLLLVFDQWTKWLAVHFLKEDPSISLIPGVLELQYLENRGAAFGILQNHQMVFVVICAVFVIAVALFTGCSSYQADAAHAHHLYPGSGRRDRQCHRPGAAELCGGFYLLFPDRFSDLQCSRLLCGDLCHFTDHFLSFLL